MKNTNVVILVLALVGIGLWILTSGNDKVNWYYSYDITDTDPFDTKLYIRLLEDRNQHLLKQESAISEEWDLSSDSSHTLLYFLDSPTLDSAHIFGLDSLVSHQGHTMFISGIENHLFFRWVDFVNNGSFDLTMYDTNVVELQYYDSSGTYLDTALSAPTVLETTDVNPSGTRTIEFVKTGTSATISLAIRNDSTDLYTRPNQSIKRNDLLELLPNAEILATVQGSSNQVVAFRVPKGKGQMIFLLADPVLTNYCLSNPQNFDFVSDLTSLLPVGPLTTDGYYPSPNGGTSGSNTTRLERSPLTFILSFPTLRWAWYLLLVSIGLFLIFRTQRRQRIVPIITSVKNQSLEFAKSLGILQFRTNRNHNHVAKEIISQFRNWSKRRFRNSIELDKEYEELLMKMRPEVKKNVRELFFIIGQVREDAPIDAEKLNKLYSITRYIYKHV